MANPSEAGSSELDDLRDDIELNTGLLQSLEGDSDTESEETRQVVRRTLKRLRKRLNALVSTGMDGAADTPDSPGVKADPDSEGRSKHLMPPPTFDLVSRKRQRGDFDDDTRESKSLRQSPNLSATAGSSPAPSADSIDSFDFDDPLLGSLLGGYSREDEKEHKAYLKSLEERKKQEEADAEFARQLQDQFNQQPPPTSSQGQSQTVLQPNGFLSRPKVEVSSASHNPVKPEPGSSSNSFRASAPPTPKREGIEEISASDFPSHIQSTYGMSGASSSQHPGFTPYSTTGSIPGAFPGPPQYGSIAGASVYNATPYNSATSNLGATNAYAMSTGVAGLLAQAGSLLNPLDLDRYDSFAQFSDPAKTQEEIQNLLKNIRPDEELTAEQQSHVPKGLKLSLMPHQASGVGWMTKMEEGTCKGGILADDMGLGKTMQSIALFLARPAPQNDRRPNLIIAPVALLQQWKREITKFVLPSHRMSVLIMHGQTRATNYNAIRNYDVVLTTYGTLASELKRNLIFEDRQKRDPEARPNAREECAILGDKSKFHRVILDEAQNIKNRNTKAAHAACRINSTYRWCLTGTPMQNSVEELYSLIKFCRIRPYSDWNQFSKDFSRPLKRKYEAGRDKAMDQLQALLKAILLRRTKKSMIDGKPILQLPEKTTVEDRAVFSEDELSFYKALETKAQIQFNKYVQDGSVGRNYSNALVLLLRLRQAACHPHLVSKSGDFQLGNLGDLKPTDMIANAKELSEEVVDRLKGMEGFECAVCMDAHENPVIFQCGHGLCEDCLAKLCDQALSSEEGSKASCPHCRSKIDASKTTNLMSFLRVYCPDRDGVEPLDEDDADEETASESSEDDTESDDGGDLDNFIVADDDDIEYDSDASEDRKFQKILKSVKSKTSSCASSRKPSKAKGKGKGKGKATLKPSLAQLRKEGLRNKSAKRKYLKKLAKDFQTSAKIDKAMKLLEQIRERGEGEKTIIFSNFTSFLDLLEVPLSRHPDFGVYARYDGSMTPGERNDAVLSFTDNKHCKVILVSLRAGNSGLNLTAANHVIMMDPFWNPFVEYQAADRAYRIGQLREVTIHRVLIGETEETNGIPDEDQPDYTVEDRILKLQAKKEALVNAALDETAGQRLGRLGVRELGYLFGVNGLNDR